MRTPWTLLAALALLAPACEDGATKVEEVAEQVATKAPRTGVATEIRLIRGQIELYKRLNDGKPPPSLQAMETLPRLQYPDEYEYDPATGTVKSASFPEL